MDLPVNWKPFWLLWSHDRKAPYANDVGQKRFCSKKRRIRLEKLQIHPKMTPFLTVLIDNYDRNRTRTLTQTQTRWLNHLIYTWCLPQITNWQNKYAFQYDAYHLLVDRIPSYRGGARACLPGGYLPGGVCLRRVSARGVVYPIACWDTHTPCEQNDRQV